MSSQKVHCVIEMKKKWQSFRKILIVLIILLVCFEICYKSNLNQYSYLKYTV